MNRICSDVLPSLGNAPHLHLLERCRSPFFRRIANVCQNALHLRATVAWFVVNEECNDALALWSRVSLFGRKDRPYA